MRKIGLVASALCLALSGVQPVQAKPHLHLTPGEVKAIATMAACRVGFSPNKSLLAAGEPYVCETANFVCPANYRLTRVGNDVKLRALTGYNCVNTTTIAPNGYPCTPPFKFYWSDVKGSTCIRIEPIPPGCRRGYEAGAEDYVHGILNAEHSDPNADLRPTHAFYSCTAKP